MAIGNLNPGEFIELLENPERVERKSVEELKKLAVQYPYSQPVQLLYTIRLSRSGEYLFNRQLGKTSLLTADRSVLFDLFEREQEEQQQDTAPAEESRSEEGPFSKENPFLSTGDAPASEDESEEESLELPVETASAKEREEEPEAEGPAQPMEQEALVKEKPEEREPATDESAAPVDEESAVPEAPKFPAEGKPVDQELSSKERIKAILEENRRLREDYEAKKKKPQGAEVSEMDARINAIKEKLSKLKRPEKTEETLQRHVPKESTVETSEFPVEEGLLPKKKENEEAETAVEPVTAREVPPENRETREDEPPSEAPAALREEQILTPGEEDAHPEEEKAVAAKHDVPDTDEPEIDDRPSEKAAVPQVDTAEEAYTFADWLKKLSEREDGGPESENTSTGTVSASPAPDAGFEKKIQLLDSFVEKLPQLKKKRNISVRPERSGIDMNKLSDEEGSLVTETLAQVYVKQNHYEKAIKAYEILKLKYPEKSSFFADRISEIKKLIESK